MSFRKAMLALIGLGFASANWGCTVAAQDSEPVAESASEALTYTGLSLINGWTGGPFATNQPAITLSGNVVHFRGAAATSGLNQQPFTLPGGFRPAQTVWIPINLCNSTKGRLEVRADGTTLVEPYMGLSANMQCFTSLDGASFALATADYTTVGLINGWTNSPFGTRVPAFRNINGIIHLAGAMSNGTSTAAFVLPAGARPSSTVYVPVDMFGARQGRLIIDTSGNVTVQAEDVFMYASQFTSLEGVSFAVNNSGFTNLTLSNSWVSYGLRTPAVKNDGGVVRFEGAIANGTTSAAFTLPAGMRPAKDTYVSVDLCNATKGRLYIQPSGAVSVQAEGAYTTATCFTSLESATFAL